MTAPDPLNLVGQTVAEKYLVEKLVGEGGFAVVYRATHAIWKKPVAIKFFNGLANAPVSQRAELQEQFIQEGALLTDLSSQTANIVQARDVGSLTTPDGQWMPYMVLEWLEGRALEDLVAAEQAAGERRWTPESVFALLAPAAAALDVAHGKGIAHRDIKPANLFVLGDPYTPGATVKVLDFGVAKMMSDNTQLQAAMAKTGQNITSFTPQYGAPEQFDRRAGATGPWTDVYALALVAVEMLAGRPALDGDNVVQLHLATSDPNQRPTPRHFGVDVSDAVEDVFQRALAVPVAARFARAGEFWAAFEAALGGRHRISATFQAPPASLYQSGANTTQFGIGATVPAHLAEPVLTRTGGATTVTGPGANKGKGGLVAMAALVVAAAGVGGFFALRKPPPSGAAATPPSGISSAAAPAANSAAADGASCPRDMILIRSGQFFMGNDADEERPAFIPSPKPSHNVKLDAFCIDRDEVSSGKYKECSDQGRCRKALSTVEFPGIKDPQRKIFDPLCTGNDLARADHPINCVDWQTAKDFCETNGRRLPTEAEWEYATRGPDGRVYPWGDEDPTKEHLNACGKECLAWGKAHGEVLDVLYDADDGWPATAPVGSFPVGSSRFGPRDVVGNVWEWVADYDGPYTAAAQVNPSGPESGKRRIIRGGAFNGWEKSWLRPSFRFAQFPEARVHAIGFRCALSVVAKAP